MQVALLQCSRSRYNVHVDEDGSEAQPETAWKDDGSLPLDSQGQLPFFLLDAHEEASSPGLVYLFGKVNTLLSCLLSPCCQGQTDCLPASEVAVPCIAASCSHAHAAASLTQPHSICCPQLTVTFVTQSIQTAYHSC
jgi:hypothetical protein